MSRMSANEIIPGKLYQRGQFLTWTYDQKRKFLSDRGITLVVNLWSKFDSDLSGLCTYFCWETSPHEVPKNAITTIDFLRDSMLNGHVVLIHCEAGRGRSVWLAARVASKMWGASGPDTWQRVKAAVPNQSVRPELLADLGVV